MFHKPWTTEEIKVLKQMYGIKSNKVLALLLDKTVSSITNKANKLNLNKPQTYNEQMCRLEDEFDGGCYYKMLDYAKTLDSSFEHVSDAWDRYGKCEFEIMYNKFING